MLMVVISQLLLEEGHAVIYDGGTKSKDWCVLGTEEPVLVWNPWLAWAVAQLFPILLSERLLFNRQRKALSVSGRLRRVLLLLVIWNLLLVLGYGPITGGNLEICETVVRQGCGGMVVYLRSESFRNLSTNPMFAELNHPFAHAEHHPAFATTTPAKRTH